MYAVIFIFEKKKKSVQHALRKMEGDLHLRSDPERRSANYQVRSEKYNSGPS